MKKWLSFALALVMALALCSVSWADSGDGTESNPYSLQEFNALTGDISGTVYVKLNGEPLQGGLDIGNDTIADHYKYTNWDEDKAPTGFPHKTDIDDFTTHDGNKVRYIYSTGKAAVKVIITGSVTGATDTGGFNAGMITMKVPDAAEVVFQGVTFGAGQMAMEIWSESNVDSMKVAHRIASVTFNGCTFKGNWIQNGAINADTTTFTGCTFEKYENTAGINSDGFNTKNNSNPIWIQNIGYTNVTIENCEFNAVRPIKLWENNATGTVTIKKNTFNMEKCSIDDENTHKNIAIMFSKCNLGKVEISENAVTGDASGFVGFYSEAYQPTMKEGATFTISDNKVPDGVKESVKWNTTEDFKQDYISVIPATPEKPSSGYYYKTPAATADEAKGSPKTFDAGVTLYAAMALASLTGLAYTAKKRGE